MICPKCGKDAGDAVVCPECSEALTPAAAEASPNSAGSKKPSKKTVILAVVFCVVAVAAIILGVVQNAKPAEYVSWSTLYNDFSTSMKVGAERYENKMLKFYIRVDALSEQDALVTCYDENWNEVTDVPLTKVMVSFVSASDVRVGEKYVIEGKISRVFIGISTGFDPIEIVNAKILETVS